MAIRGRLSVISKRFLLIKCLFSDGLLHPPMTLPRSFFSDFCHIMHVFHSKIGSLRYSQVMLTENVGNSVSLCYDN